MKEIFQEYGGILITVTAVVAVIGVVIAIVGTDSTGIIGSGFSGIIKKFIDTANSAAGI